MRASLIAVALLLAGCAQLKPDHAGAPGEVIAIAVETSRLPAETQRRVLARTDEEFAREASDANRARLAALLVMLPAPMRDDARAASLLQPLAAGDATRPLVQFATLLAAQIAERQRVLRAGERREELARERESAGKERESALRQQIEALRSIERGILEREDRARSRAR